jgi:hypothetical protein
MDTTDLERMLQELDELDPADAPEPADAIADRLAEDLDGEPQPGEPT